MALGFIDQLLRILDDAFDGDSEHSVVANLRNVDNALWHAAHGGRTIAEIGEHVGRAKYVYENFAFGDGTLTWDHPSWAPAAERPREETIAWMREGHRRLIASVRGLDDSAIDRPLSVHDGGPPVPAGDLLATLARHDVYHAGEINHLRSLLQGTDHWNFHA